MPRIPGTGVYEQPAPDVITATTIESTVYNAFVNDVETDLNTPRPVTSGGTGANNAADAATNLKAVSYGGAQALTDAEKLVARTNIAAVPFDAMAYSGMQVNGSMEVNQERGHGPATTTSGAYVCDGFVAFKNGTMAFSAGTTLGAPIYSGIIGTLFVTIGTAQTTLGGGDYLVINHPIEGWRTERLGWGLGGAQPLIIAFWSSHLRTGVYTVAIKNVPATRSYCATYTHVATNTPQYNVITIPGDVTGTWAKDNTAGILLQFVIASGIVASSANTWLAGSFQAAPGQVNGVGAVSDVFRITGLVVLPGTQAPTAAQSPLIMRPYDQELVTCQRYYQKSYPQSIAVGAGVGAGNNKVFYGAHAAGGVYGPTLTLAPVMRANPTVQVFDGVGTPGKIGYYDSAWRSGGTGPTIMTGDRHAYFQGSIVGAVYYNFDFTADARL